MEKSKQKEAQVIPMEEFDDTEWGDIDEKKRKIKDRFFDACKNGNLEALKHYINNPLLDVLEVNSEKWTGVNWCVVKNQPEAVKIVYAKQKQAELELAEAKKKKEEETTKAIIVSDFDEAFKKPLNPADDGKYSPLHWSAYKGYDIISSILLKMECDPLSVDIYGNNAWHQAAASNNYDTFKLFMGWGIDLWLKNARSHSALDLTTNKAIQDLLTRSLSIKFCQICEKQFTFNNRRFLCSIHEEVICRECCVVDYYYVAEDSVDKDFRDCRCKNCYNEIADSEALLRAAIQSNNLENLNKQAAISNQFKICLHLRKEARENQDRLRREKEITALLDSLKVVDDYKTIPKSVYELEKMCESADENKVNLDPVIIRRAFQQKNRWWAENELRCKWSNITVELSSPENLATLSEKVENAKNCQVDACYVDVGVAWVEKIRLHLAASELLKMFIEYPLREYPEVEVIDPKNKKKAAASPPKKKKKKKEPPVIIPDWAKELVVLVEKVDDMKKYVGMYKELGLKQDFEKQAKEQLVRFGKEIPFRREQEEIQRKLEEERAKRKKNKKKK